MRISKKTFREISYLSAVILGLSFGSSIAISDDDSSFSDAPQGFGEVISGAKGVVLRVPINEAGEENTDAAELRFTETSTVSSGTDVRSLWNQATPVNMTEEVTGTSGPVRDPKRDSSTWGWYNWYRWGWSYPYYYSYYYPTFYYNYSWYYYRYYYYWNWYSYRYYYYRWWW